MVSDSVSISGFEEGKFEGDSPTEEVAAQIRLKGADPLQLCAQEIDEAAKIAIVVQRNLPTAQTAPQRPLFRSPVC